MQACNLFDRYRDGELDTAGRKQFESHLSKCESCRLKASVLRNVVYVLRNSEALPPADLPERTARRAFRPKKSWDALVISWLQPTPALVALATAVLLFSFLWLVPSYRPVDAYSDYETLMNEDNALDLVAGDTQVHSDSELVIWLEQEGRSE